MADLLGSDFGLAEAHKLYVCHDLLLAHKDALFSHLTERWRDLFNADFEVLTLRSDQHVFRSGRKGYEEIVVQDLVLNPSVTLYRRERWETPDGQTLIAPLDQGIVGGYGPHLHRLVLVLHFQGQMTCERILALLNGAGVVISKRQVVRLLAAKLETFRAEDEEVLTAGLSGSRFVRVDDTGARHQGKSGFTTHIGSDRFAVFRTGPSKSRLAFLRAGRPATSSMKPRLSTCETTTFPRPPSTSSRTARCGSSSPIRFGCGA